MVKGISFHPCKMTNNGKPDVIFQEAFNDKFVMMKSKLEKMEDAGKKGSHPIDVSLAKLQKKLREGSTMETGERGANKVGNFYTQILVPARKC